MNWGSRPLGLRVVGGGKKVKKNRGCRGDEAVGEGGGQKRMNTHRLLGLSAHDEGIRQRSSRRSRHFSLYFSPVVSASLSAELVSPQTTRDLGN